MYTLEVSTDGSFLSRLLKRPETLPLLFFFVCLALWMVFLSKVHSELQPENVIEHSAKKDEPIASINSDEQNMVDQVNQLMEQLTAQQEKADELTRVVAKQKSELSDLLTQELNETDGKDTTYLSKLEQLDGKAKVKEMSKKALGSTDYYNRVVIQENLSNLNKDSIQGQINQFILQQESNTTKKSSNYTETLDKESAVRENEVRSIILKRGESIWMIAKRAYGKGRFYTKILKANPQITEKNARHLATGTIIRVPI